MHPLLNKLDMGNEYRLNFPRAISKDIGGIIKELIANGKNTKEIASQMYITTGTVRNYISVILDKLDVTNRIEAISRFKEKGWFK